MAAKPAEPVTATMTKIDRTLSRRTEQVLYWLFMVFSGLGSWIFASCVDPMTPLYGVGVPRTSKEFARLM